MIYFLFTAVNVVVRKAALFSCLTGLRISDILRLKWENIFSNNMTKTSIYLL